MGGGGGGAQSFYLRFLRQLWSAKFVRITLDHMKILSSTQGCIPDSSNFGGPSRATLQRQHQNEFVHKLKSSGWEATPPQ